MERLTIAAATAWDLADALDERGEAPLRMTRAMFGIFARQTAAGASIAWRDSAGDLVMICGLYPCEGWIEAWWAVGPALRAHLRPAIRSARHLLEEIAGEAAPVEVRAHVPADSVAGHRVARLLGLRLDHLAAGGLAIWRRDF